MQWAWDLDDGPRNVFWWLGSIRITNCSWRGNFLRREILKNNSVPWEREGISLPLSASESILATPGCWQHGAGFWGREAVAEPPRPQAKAAFSLGPGCLSVRPSVLQAGLGWWRLDLLLWLPPVACKMLQRRLKSQCTKWFVEIFSSRTV